MTELTPFTVDVPEADLDDLRRRLAATRLPDAPRGIDWSSGVERGYLAELLRVWRDEFDWRAVEKRLNAWPQVTTTIDGQPVHAVHARSDHADAVPLLLLHGWPSTPADFLLVLPALVERFHVVAPSLPGSGLSGPTLEVGWDLDRYARTLLELMSRAGHERFVVQGGDWGALIGPHLARLAPERVALVHVNALATPADWRSGDPTTGLSEEDAAQVFALGALWEVRSGYATIMGTRPQTLAYALADSPVGLLAWHLEWFVDYDPGTTAQTPVDPVAILTDVTTTWLTGTAASSGRIYRECHDAFVPHEPSGVPTAVACFTGDHTVRGLAERSHRIVRWRRYDTGGHFASLQAPELLVADLVEACEEHVSAR
ncbi:epoxide hydrolase family protein [Actinomycetospora corticicola]|uniref:Pimeloyl-ACP methyl ester carboxylesterase n=1 Tax=Actinomycetospora corticicola TaxID=663602 RepID=A0A7Y9DYX2_9PSEU|nr:epoxide hydrolase family protein [Actinomycetospora corticicola]NYD37950.1 pimeloyl-ACP methyl ester carboxylesterase [Actinomycetospora corticicola]